MRLSKFISVALLTTSILAEEIPEQILNSVYLVNASVGVSTAAGSANSVDLSEFGLMGKRYLITAAHVVVWDDVKDGSRYAEIVKIEYLLDDKRKWISCKIVAIDEEADVCILEAQEDLPYQLKL